MFMGSLLAFVAGWHYLLVIDADDLLWSVLFWSGIGLFVIGIVVPQLLAPLDRAWMALASLIGRVVFTLILTVIYFVLITPVGMLMKIRQRRSPIVAWGPGEVPSDVEGWTEKTVEVSEGAHPAKRRPAIVAPFDVIVFFVRHRQWIVIPTVVILAILGIILFFAQSSVLAPLIYTIF